MITSQFHLYSLSWVSHELDKLVWSQHMSLQLAQLVGKCNANAEAMGLNPVEALKLFLKFVIA